MEKGYYCTRTIHPALNFTVSIHNKNGKGLLLPKQGISSSFKFVSIHNKNGKGLLLKNHFFFSTDKVASQSTIKMEKGYYTFGTKRWRRKSKSLNPQ